MNKSLSTQQASWFQILALCLITCLILLINLSFKITNIMGLVFAVNSLLCPLIAFVYLLALRNCSFKEQRHLLNISLMTLYLFCIGVYVLVNLPASEYMNDNQVYQIIFEDIPKKFFATTIAFGLSFYFPHLLFCTRSPNVLASQKHCLLLALFGGLAFFTIDFYLLFSGIHSNSFKQILIDSFMIAALILLIMGVVYLSVTLYSKKGQNATSPLINSSAFPVFQYLVCFSVVVMLICLACEYRIVSFGRGNMITASSLFFPITLMMSTLVGEGWGYKANLKFAVVLIATQIVFDGLLMGLVALPSPSFFNLNPFYNYIMPRRLPAASLAIFVTFVSNTVLLHRLKSTFYGKYRPLRILIANVLATSLLCLVNYSLLFGGIYSYEQIIHLAVNVWQYKLLMTVMSLPVVLWLYRWIEEDHEEGVKRPVVFLNKM